MNKITICKFAVLMDYKILLSLLLFIIPLVVILIGLRKNNQKLIIAGVAPLIYLLCSYLLDWIFD